MSFGYERQKRVFVNDTALLEAYIYEADNETLIPLTAINQALLLLRSLRRKARLFLMILVLLLAMVMLSILLTLVALQSRESILRQLSLS